MSETKTKAPKITSPKGVAVWPKLNEPDRRFKAEGEYSVKLRLRKDAEGVPEFLAKLQEFHKTLSAQAQAEGKEAWAKAKAAGKKPKPFNNDIVPPSITDVTDDNDQPTGEVEIKFGMKALVKPKDGTPWEQRPALFDAKGAPVTPGTKVGPGSIIRVNFSPVPFFTPLVGSGMSLRLNAVKIIERREWSADASYYGFGEEEEGYTFEEGDSSDSDSGSTDGGASATDDKGGDY
jgi:hypothetical protein